MIKKLTILIFSTIIILTILTFLIILTNSTNTVAIQDNNEDIETSGYDLSDIDPLADLEVTVTIKEIRALDRIDLFSDPDFYVKVFINDVEHISPVWRNQKYLKPNWYITQDVPDNEEYVNIKIQLWDRNTWKDRICDISGDSEGSGKDSVYSLDLTYSLKSGHWWGDDYIYPSSVMFDPSGYGRANGCDDNSIYQFDRDCEIWFEVSQNDYDGDGIPFWTELNVFGTDPKVDDSNRDDDCDEIPMGWEFKWGHYYNERYEKDYWLYDPFNWDDHRSIDLDNDGLDNVEEFLTSEWGSDPFRQDIFLELNKMEIGPNGEGGVVPEESKDLIVDAFSKHNFVFHIIDADELIPFDADTTDAELQELYLDYFLDGDPDNWKRGVMHCGLVIYHSTRIGGFCFASDVNGTSYLDSFQVSTRYLERTSEKASFVDKILRRSFKKEQQRVMVYAGALMHETGHTLGIFNWNTPGCDSISLKWIKYRSCMSYLYTYYLIDYSDGSRGKNDFDDWNNIDLTFFQNDFGWR